MTDTTAVGRRQIALQLYTIRRELDAAPERSLERVREMGYEAVEVAPATEALPSARLAKLLCEFDLKVAAIHSDLPTGPNADPTLELANVFGCRRLIWHGWPRDPLFNSLEGVRTLIGRYDEAKENAAHSGVRLGLHNHWWEFAPVDGAYPYQLFLQQVSREVFFEVDTYWVRTAGLDPAAVLSELGARVEMLHLKDGPARHGEPMQALGDGVMNFSVVLSAAAPAVEWLVVELDECATDIWTAVQKSFDYLSAARRGVDE